MLWSPLTRYLLVFQIIVADAVRHEEFWEHKLMGPAYINHVLVSATKFVCQQDTRSTMAHKPLRPMSVNRERRAVVSVVMSENTENTNLNAPLGT